MAHTAVRISKAGKKQIASCCLRCAMRDECEADCARIEQNVFRYVDVADDE